MGLVQRDGIHRLRHAKKYSDLFDSFCTNLAWTGFTMGTGRLLGPDPREMAKSDCVVIWGTNAVVTQVNVMTHAVRARKERGAKIVVIDVYDNATMKQADMGLIVKPGTDGALACAVMHVLFRDGLADRDYLAKYTDDPAGLEAICSRARRNGRRRSRAFRWPRSRPSRGWSAPPGAPSSGSATASRGSATAPSTCMRRCRIAAVTGAWQYEGGGAFHSNSDIFKLDKSELEGRRYADPRVRHLDQSKIGRVLTGDPEALYGGPPVTALFVQNTNPANVAPEQRLVKRGHAARRPVHLRARAVHDRHGASSPTSCCRPPCSSSMTTSIAAAATSTSSSGRS